MTDRTTELEEQIAHLSRTVDELSDMVAIQGTEIERLTHRVQMLLERAAEQEADGDGGVVIAGETPPHY